MLRLLMVLWIIVMAVLVTALLLRVGKWLLGLLGQTKSQRHMKAVRRNRREFDRRCPQCRHRRRETPQGWARFCHNCGWDYKERQPKMVGDIDDRSLNRLKVKVKK